MAIQTEETINIMYGETVVDTYGLSDTLDNYSIDEIKDYLYCSFTNKLVRGFMEKVDNASVQDYNDVLPFAATPKGTAGVFEINVNDSSQLPLPSGAYCFVVWMQSTQSRLEVINSSMADYKMVTEMPANKMKYILPDPIGEKDNITSWVAGDGSGCYATGSGAGSLNYVYNLEDIELEDIQPYFIIVYNDTVFFWRFTQNEMTFYTRPNDHGIYGEKYVGGIAMYDITRTAYSVMGAKIRTLDIEGGLPYDWSTGTGSSTSDNPASWGDCDDDCIWYAQGGGNQQDVFGTMRFWWCLNTRHQSLLFWAGCGVKFYADKLYKPIIEGGYVTGYTDNMDEPSELDEWTGSTKHDVSPTPPTPPPGPYDDDPWSGATFAGTGVGGAGAFAKVYYMTSTELANLRSWMNSINVPEGFDPMQQIIGLSQVPVALSGSSSENVVFVNSSAVYDPGVTTRAVDTGVSTQQSMGTPISYYLGSVDIVRRMQQRGEPYLDYDCQIELYLPLIGMFSLDTQAVMGRTIYAYAVLDPVSGTLADYAYVSKDGQNLPVAYGSTTIGVDLPISAQQLSVSRAALKQANAQLGTSLLSSALSMIAISSSGGKGSSAGAKTTTGSSGVSAAGIREAGGDYMKASQVGNVFGDFMNWGRTIRQLSYGNNTAISGSFGGSTAQWAYPFTPYVKIIRPRYEKPSNYAHSQGVPCVQTKTVGSCTGFIQCINPDVSGITGATDLELQAIQAALSNGIYAGGGS